MRLITAHAIALTLCVAFSATAQVYRWLKGLGIDPAAYRPPRK